MAKTWEDVEWGSSTDKKEWVVEYTVEEGGTITLHLTILSGEDRDEIEKGLLKELRSVYIDGNPIEVTVHRMEVIHESSESQPFDGMFSP
ncbi:MAG: hypothetical protein CMA63_04650 [Euryarchaeota archaeon]|nr:hypothetical protein [Euryarchaeota archaeon]|tara:strand:- start:13615 stop:13884 length:270 start_codon:yes stop_codon:yes gene_type:complete